MSAPSVGYYFPSDSILLRLECEGAEGGKFECGDWACVRVQLLVANGKTEVVEAERMGAPGMAVFARAEEEEEGKPCHVNGG